ncbi:hypothetical protein HK105_203690 [Polyrhizophydium stewartii]|uniref:Fe2OG dioxygenase domain-containing protein n=1 Tax=Polyrhizophydium stewartii TaxID=2732419 RepID=A0ABR4NBN2_9FUNG
MDGDTDCDSLFGPETPEPAQAPLPPACAAADTGDDLAWLRTAPQPVAAVPGLVLWKQALLPEVLEPVLAAIDHAGWFRPADGINQAMRFGSLPRFLAPIELVGAQVIDPQLDGRDPLFDQMIANHYLPGEGLPPHVDLVHRFADGIVVATIAGTCTMVFAPVDPRAAADPVSVFLEPGDVVGMSGDVRWRWTHGIPATTHDEHGGVSVARSRRISTSAAAARETPLPAKTMFVLCAVIFCEPMSMTILFPFVYFMVRDFHLADDKDIGFFVGLIASSFSLAQFLTSIMWGWISDRIGRRPVLLVGLIGNSVTIVMFGLSRSLAWAVASRALCGLLNGNVGVAKSVLGEITDETNQARAFSLFGLMFSIGMIIGPMLGGFLAHPAETMPAVFGGVPLLRDNPYLLPCLVSSTVSICGFVFGALHMPETARHLGGYHAVRDEEIDIADNASDGGGGAAAPLQSDCAAQDTPAVRDSTATAGATPRTSASACAEHRAVPVGERRPDLLSRSSFNGMPLLSPQSSELHFFGSDRSGNQGVPTAAGSLGAGGMRASMHRAGSAGRALLRRSPRADAAGVAAPDAPRSRSCSVCSARPGGGSGSGDCRNIDIEIVSCSDGSGGDADSDDGEDEQSGAHVSSGSVLSIGWPAATAVSGYALLAFQNIIYDETFPLWAVAAPPDGLGFTSHSIGMCLSAMGVVTLFCQLVAYPWLARRVPPLVLYRATMPCYICIFTAFPLISTLLAARADLAPAKWACLLVLMAMRYTAGVTSFTSVMIMITNSAPRGKLGIVNGIGQTCAAFVRSVGPALGGMLWAWSSQSGLGFPLDSRFMFVLMGVLASVSSLHAWFVLPSTIGRVVAAGGAEHDMVPAH